jgi:hypothetical protein
MPFNGQVYITGQCCGFLPLTADATQSTTATCSGAFLAIFDPIQTASLVLSTFLFGSAVDKGSAVARAPSGDIWVAGFTTSTNFPLVRPLMNVGGGNGSSVFITRYSLATSSPAAPLQITLKEATITVSWSDGTLQQADTPLGPSP